MRVAVIGAGKMGLPLACQFAAHGAVVVACDANRGVVDAINDSRLTFDEPGVEELLRSSRAAGRLSATTDIAAGVRGCDVVVVIVPVLLTPDREADLSIMESVTRAIASSLVPGMMVCYETTLPVGTTRKILCPLLESSGLRAGVDFDLVFSPERVKSRLVLKHLTLVPKIVGGVSPGSACRGERFYGEYLGAPVINLATLEAAEFAKLAGMIYRDVNISLANELAAYAEAIGVDFAAVRTAANTDGEAYLLNPGIGVGGHCAPVYPYFALKDAGRRGMPMPLTRSGREMNDRQAARLLERLEKAGLPLKNQDVLILGLGFRPSVKEHMLSPAFLIRDFAETRGARVTLNDPLYAAAELATLGFEAGSLEAESLPAVLVLNTAHPQYESLDFADLKRRGVQAIVDGRTFWNPQSIRAAGLLYVAPGVPAQYA